MLLQVFIGWLKAPKAGAEVDCLYIGFDGAVGEAKAAEAAKSEKYSRMGKIMGSLIVPIPVDPTPTLSSGAPPERKRIAAKAPKVAEPPKHISDREKTIADERRARLAVPVAPGADIQKRDAGPTLEQYREAGYPDSTYPPQGYDAKDSPAYRDLLVHRTNAVALEKQAADKLAEEQKVAASAAPDVSQAEQPTQAEAGKAEAEAPSTSTSRQQNRNKRHE